MTEFIRIAQFELTLDEYQEGDITREIQNLINSVKSQVGQKENLEYRTDIGKEGVLYIGVEK